MNHRPFEEWLLDEQRLTSEQARELQTHLHACPSCTAVAEINLALRSAPHLSPAPGFSRRFQQRLRRYHRTQRQRQALGMLTLLLGSAGLLYGLAGPLVQEVMRSPAQWLIIAVQSLLFVVMLIQAVGAAVQVIALLSPAAGFLTLALVGALALLWVSAIRHTTRPLQGV